MIVVRVELHSAITGEVTEIARAVIDNIGGTHQAGDYRARTIKGRSQAALHRAMFAVLKGQEAPVRQGKIIGHPRLTQHVWNLVATPLLAMGYGN